MSVTQPTDDNGNGTDEDNFEIAMETAKAVVSLNPNVIESEAELIFPKAGFDSGTVEESLAWAMGHEGPAWKIHKRQRPAERVDGAKPRDLLPREAQSILFDAALGEPETEETVFRVITEYKNRYNDQKIEIDAPAPWETPDGITDPNDVITGIGDWDDYHWDLDKDRGVWTLDANAVDPLREATIDAGYEWVDERDESSQDDGDEDEAMDALDLLTWAAEEGDEIEVRYHKKNGNGVGMKAGVVESAKTGEIEDEYGYTPTQGVLIRRDDGGVTKIRRDDEGEPGVFSNSQYPYMGEPISVELIPTESDEVDIEEE